MKYLPKLINITTWCVLCTFRIRCIFVLNSINLMVIGTRWKEISFSNISMWYASVNNKSKTFLKYRLRKMGKENIWSSWGIAEICQNKKEWKTFLASLPYFNTFVNISYKIEMENFLYMRNSNKAYSCFINKSNI